MTRQRGVGKSSVAAMIAVSWVVKVKKVGVLDAISPALVFLKFSAVRTRLPPVDGIMPVDYGERIKLISLNSFIA